jgi:DNA-binding transcriptional ArsR family regulator
MPPDRISTAFAELADPTRSAILARLAFWYTSASELAKPLAMGLRTISKHLNLKILGHAGDVANDDASV